MKIEELKIIANKYHEWIEELTDYPASSYNLEILLSKGTANKVKVSVSEEGNNFKCKIISGDITSGGTYTYQAYAIDKTSKNTYFIKQGVVNVIPDLTTETLYWQEILQEAKELYKKLMTKEADSVSINGKTITYAKRKELLELITHAEYMINKEVGNTTKTNRVYKARMR